MPKILRIINRFNLGGPTFNAALLTKHLAPEYETLLIGGKHEAYEDPSVHILNGLGIEPGVVDNLQREIDFRKDRAAYREIKEIIADFKPDIVHTHAAKAGTLGRLAASKMKVPVICHTFHGHVFHSYFGKTKTNFYKRVERFLARKSSQIIAISDTQKKELWFEHGICPEDKIRVIRNGFDLELFHTNQKIKRKDFRKEFGLEDYHIAITIVGRLVPIKNHDLFLRAFANIANENTHIRALIVGDGELRQELKTLCEKLGLTHGGSADRQVIFTSWRKDIDKVMASSDIVALSSLNEGTPVTLIEAQAASKPIVATNVGGIRDIVLPGKNAILVPTRDVAAFSNALYKLATRSDLRDEMSQHGQQFALDNFNYSRLVGEMDALYRELLQQT